MLQQAIQDKANAAIAQHVGLWLSPEQAQAIQQQYGFATFTLVRQVYDFAVSQPADWSSATLEQHLSVVADTLKMAYPFLSEESIRRLVNCFAYAWK
ncbi:hypothetical protein [Hymenobacter metallilatus]|uniref:Uncharacterized protein n=1 Tax=Hymenobacter metallilatus TaxID=2493666 RepID=A0A428JF58_9BACT|nr:hypothetical protein [Hymenobacter metallilatus]RSK31196.1 hypothetical protein EI290_14345 [Hymenobacter metallilatus]